MPKCVVTDGAAARKSLFPSRRREWKPPAWTDTVIYEAHVKGMTQLHPRVPHRQRGTFAGLASPHVIDHLVKLGVTAIELMPVQAFCDDSYLGRQGPAQLLGLQRHCLTSRRNIATSAPAS